MFRLISANAQQGIRPAIFLKIRSGKSGIGLPGSGPSAGPSGGPTAGPTAGSSAGGCSGNQSQYMLTCQFTRQNSSVALGKASSTVDALINKVQRDPLMREAVESETKVKLSYFKEQMTLANQYRYSRDWEGQRAFATTMDNLFRAFEDEELRVAFSSKDLFSYSQILNFSVYNNRTRRLSGNKNRDSDQYHNENLLDEVSIKSAVMSISDLIVNGEFKKILNPDTLLYIFFSMKQYLLHAEMLNLWENGVNDEEIGKMYLNEKILAVILPIAYEQKRFSYEEILHIYEINTKDSLNVKHDLLCSIGKIAISAGDYSRGLDALEGLLLMYESKQQQPSFVLASLGELHLTFIGLCKDIKISKHFFDKVVQYDLPYNVNLKVPYVQSLLNNCFELNEPFENLIYFWSSTIKHYHSEKSSSHLNSRYAILNNAFFAIFFKTYPTLTTESFSKLKEVIAIYSEIKSVDEFFLNTIIGNYSWGFKDVLEELIENYSVFNVNRTPVSYRICLKKTGELQDYSNSEILAKWNESLRHLDENNFKYIPIADWAALRDSTILSPNSSQRTDFYLAVLSKYKDYFQDQRTCLRFLKFWLKKKEHLEDIKRLTYEPDDSFLCDIDIEVLAFRNLRPNINYKKISKAIY